MNLLETYIKSPEDLYKSFGDFINGYFCAIQFCFGSGMTSELWCVRVYVAEPRH